MAPSSVEMMVAGTVIQSELKKLRFIPSHVPATQAVTATSVIAALPTATPHDPQGVGHKDNGESRQHHDRSGGAFAYLSALEHQVVDVDCREGGRYARSAASQRSDKVEGLDRELDLDDRDRNED